VTMRVLFVTNYQQVRARSSAAGIFVEREMQSLRDLGVDMSEYDIGASYAPRALVRGWRGLRAEIRRTRPDLLHAQYGTIVALIAVLTMHPTVITFGGGDLQPGEYHSGAPGAQPRLAVPLSWLRSYAAIVLSHAAALLAVRMICVSERLRSALRWRRGAAAVIPRGVDLAFFSPGSRDEARALLGWDPRARVVLTDGGRDWKTKGLDITTAAVDLAKKSLPDLELRVIRDIPPHQMPLLYRAADVLVCASRAEGSPNVVKEALGCALPVIGVRVGDVEERLAGVTPSAIVDRTPEAIASAIVELVRDPRRSNGPEVIAPLSRQRTAERILDVYRAAARMQA
jgi:glycosyltransferase involved in cell wall biosynthesis